MKVSLGSFLESINCNIESQDPDAHIWTLLEEMTTTKPPEKIRVLIQYLIPRDALFATFLLKCRYIKGHPLVDTAAVNIKEGKVNFYYDEKFINKFPVNQLMFIIAHEFYHIARLHLDRAARRKMNNELHNIASDMIINENILSDLKSVAGMSLAMPQEDGKDVGLRIDKKYAEKVKDSKLWTTESLYRFLEKTGPPPGKQPTKKDLLKPGMTVRIGDGEDFGIIEKVNKDGTYDVKSISAGEAKKRVQPA